MDFRTKRELLRFLGKNADDRKLVDRMIMKGDVKMENGVYMLVDRVGMEEENEKLKKEIKSLRERVSELEYEIENAQPSVDYSDIYKRIYAYLKQVLHINVSYDDLVEFVENYPSD